MQNMNPYMHDSGRGGLTRREAALLRLRFGENVVYKKERFRPFAVFLEKFKSPLLVVLICASLVSFFLKESINASIILVMVLLSAVLDFINTYKSERASELLNSKVTTTATVMRDGKREEIELRYLVPGDLVLLSAGDIVPADCELVEAKDFFIDQSVLTGESFPVEKTAALQPLREEEASVFDASNRIFMGTTAVTGYASVLVLETGERTEFGKVAAKLRERVPETDFERGVKQFSFFTMRVTLFLVLVVFFVNIFLNKGLFDSFLFAVAVAVGLTPELLPVIMTVAMSHGSVKMAKKDVVVKNLSAIQSFGSMDVLCTDKTGTLTENKIALVKYIDIFGQASDTVLLYAYLGSTFHTAIRSPLDDAIQSYKKLSVREYKKIDEIPFDFARRRDSVVVEKGGARMILTKGAPEDVLKISKFYRKGERTLSLTPNIQKMIHEQFEKLSEDGFRVLAIAVKEVPDIRDVYEERDERGTVFFGFVAFLDPPKKTVLQAIRNLENLGIEVKILTGDSARLTRKVCSDILLPVRGILEGKELRLMSDAELEHRVGDITVFARITPEDKARIILAIKKTGKAVGYLGDGINDAPALKAADVGISVNNGVDVAKESADIILLQKSLHVLKDGVIEGRKTFQNTMKYVLLGLSSNFGNMISMTGVSFFLPFLPMLPSQILLNNFLYDVSQVTLPTDSVDESDILHPSQWDLGFIKKFMLTFGLVSSVFDFIAFAVLGFVFRLAGSPFQTGWFVISLATQIFVIYIIRTKKIPFMESGPSAPLFATTLAVVIVGWILPYSPFARLLGFSPLPVPILAASALIVVSYLFVVELTKRGFYAWHRSR